MSSELKDIKIDCSDVFVENFEQNTLDISDLENSEKAKNEEIYSIFEKKNELIQHVDGNNSVYINFYSSFKHNQIKICIN